MNQMYLLKTVHLHATVLVLIGLPYAFRRLISAEGKAACTACITSCFGVAPSGCWGKCIGFSFVCFFYFPPAVGQWEGPLKMLSTWLCSGDLSICVSMKWDLRSVCTLCSPGGKGLQVSHLSSSACLQRQASVWLCFRSVPLFINIL